MKSSNSSCLKKIHNTVTVVKEFIGEEGMS